MYKIKNYLAWVINLLLILFILLSNTINTNASILVTPKSSNQEKSLFYKAKAGDVVTESFDITNTDQEPNTFNLQINDISVTDSGAITILSNNEENNSLGGWIQALTGSITIGPNAKVNIPLQITVPLDAKVGEYGAAISILAQTANTANSSIKNTVRKGLKIYVYVSDGNLPVVSSTVTDLNLLDIGSSEKENLQKKLSFWDKNNMVFSLNAQDTGNTFSVIKGVYSIDYEDGEVRSSNFSTNLAPGVGEKEYYISTNLPYKQGKTKIKLEYAVEALNKMELGETKNENISGSLIDEIDTNQKSISQFRGIEKVQIPDITLDRKAKIIKNLVIILFTIIGFFILKKLVKSYKKTIDKE
jgi:hypothetical protein